MGAAVVVRRLAGVLLLIASAASCAGGGDSVDLPGINKGSVAVDFELPDLDGEEITLSDYRGSVVLINFWATWCPPCRAEIPDIEEAYQARRDEGFMVLGVSVEQAPDHVESFVEAMGMSYPVLLDEAGVVSGTYRAPGLPISLFLDREGVIRIRHVGQLTSALLEQYLAELLP